MIRTVAPLSLCMLFFSGSLALAGDIPSFEESLSMKSAGGAVISPDGRYVAHTIRSTDWAPICSRTTRSASRFAWMSLMIAVRNSIPLGKVQRCYGGVLGPSNTAGTASRTRRRRGVLYLEYGRCSVSGEFSRSGHPQNDPTRAAAASSSG